MIAKIQNKITVALAAVALLIVATFVFSPAVSAQTQVQNGLCAGSTLEFTDQSSGGAAANAGKCATVASDGSTDKVNSTVALVINIFSWVVGIVAVIMIIVGGFKYITSGGDSGKITSAKNSIIYAIIGLIIVALAQIIVQFVLTKII
ncbi:MAG: hypothetical protein WBP26_05620 [Candidatus Saccharimonadales bacterium]